MMMKTLAVALKEWQLLLREPGQLVTLFLFPLMFATIIGSAFGGGDSPQVSVFLVNQDTGELGQQVSDTLSSIETLRLTTLDTVDEADRRIADGDALAAIVIPVGFTEKINTYEQTQVQVIVNPTQQQFGSLITGMMAEVLTPVTLQGEIQYGIRTVLDESGAFVNASAEVREGVAAMLLGVVMTRLQELFQNPQINVISQDWEGEMAQNYPSAYSYSFPSYAVMFAFFIIGTVAATVVLERENGTYRRLVAAPISKASILFGKMLGYMVIIVVQVFFVLGVGSVVFDIPLGNSPTGLVLTTVVLALVATALGMLIAALAKTRSQMDAVGMLLIFLLAGLGGSLVQLPDSGVLGFLSKLTPHNHAIEAYRLLMVEGGGVVDILPQLALLGSIGILFFAIALVRFRFE